MKSSLGVVVEWLAILFIAAFVLPYVLRLVFGGISGLAGEGSRSGVMFDPFAAADYRLAQNILSMR